MGCGGSVTYGLPDPTHPSQRVSLPTLGPDAACPPRRGSLNCSGARPRVPTLGGLFCTAQGLTPRASPHCPGI